MDTQEIRQTVAKNIRSEREKQGLSREELAHLAGIDKSTLERIEVGKSNPFHETIVKIARALQVSTDSFSEEFYQSK